MGNLSYVLNIWFAHSGAPLMGFRSRSGCGHPIGVRLWASDWGPVTGNPRNHSLRTPRPPYGLLIGSPKRAGMPHSESYSGNGGGQERLHTTRTSILHASKCRKARCGGVSMLWLHIHYVQPEQVFCMQASAGRRGAAVCPCSGCASASQQILQW